jgi:hypothetical protein
MPRTCTVDPFFQHVLAAQDFVVHRQQALAAGLTPDALAYRLSTKWRTLLPSVYLTHRGEPARRQRLMAGLLYAGPDSAIDGIDACHFYGLKALRPDDELVHVAVPAVSQLRSIRWLVVRRTSRPFGVRTTAFLRYVEPAAAVIATTRTLRSPRMTLAVMSDAVQRGIVSIDELRAANRSGPRHNGAIARLAVDQLDAGVRSTAEADFATLAERAPGLPQLMYNPLLRLPDGSRIRPDAVAPDVPLIHETNGAIAHRRQDLFEDMQRRHDALTAAGFTVLHNAPTRIRNQAPAVITEFTQCYLRLRGSSWPTGVVLLDDGKSRGSIAVKSH